MVKSFGPSILRSDGEIDRDVLGILVFENASARKKLNKATHPVVTWEIAKQIFISFMMFKRLVVRGLPQVSMNYLVCVIWSSSIGGLSQSS